METKLVRIDLTQCSTGAVNTGAAASALELEVSNICKAQTAAGFHLIASFVFGTDLILIFQD